MEEGELDNEVILVPPSFPSTIATEPKRFSCYLHPLDHDG
jgi:hypothetical protein